MGACCVVAVDKCIDEFIKGDNNSLNVSPKGAAAQNQEKADELQKVAGEQALVIRVLKKPRRWPESIFVSIRLLCEAIGIF
jgi:hypothetical protein